jgi:hypothetical protein
MKRKLHTPEQIVKKLRQADAVIASGGTVEQVSRHLFCIVPVTGPALSTMFVFTTRH